MGGLNKMCVFSVVIKLALGNIIRRGGVMKPKKYPYSGKTKIIRKEMPRFIMLSYTAFDSRLVDHIDTMVQTGISETLITFKIPRFFSYEEKQIRVPLPLIKVVKILNQY